MKKRKYPIRPKKWDLIGWIKYYRAKRRHQIIVKFLTEKL